MSRPIKCRRVENLPKFLTFVPTGEHIEGNEKIFLLLEEFEAIRLKDLNSFDQQECAEKMQVSRPTFQRILSSARKKIAKSLCEGKPIGIYGGECVSTVKRRCKRCGKVHDELCRFKEEQTLENSSIEEICVESKLDYICPHCKKAHQNNKTKN